MRSLDLPSGWRWSTLGEMAGSSGLFTDGDWILSRNMSPDGKVRLLQLADIGVGRFLDKSARFITEDTCRDLNCTLLKPGDVLISRMAHPIARACMVPEFGYAAITAVDVSILRVDPSISDARFVMFLCNSRVVREQAEEAAAGTTRKRITRRKLEKLSIPLPPLEEQRRIAARIEGLIRPIEEAKRLRQVAREQAEKIMPAALAEVFERAENEGWETRVLDGLLLLCHPGTWGEGDASKENGYPVLRSTNIHGWKLDLSADVAFRRVAPDDVRKYALAPGDIIVTRSSGSPHLIGEAALFNLEQEQAPFLFSNFTQRLRPNQDIVLPKYLWNYLRAPQGRAVVDQMHRTTSGLRNLKMRQYRAQLVPVPSVQEQRYVVSYLDALQAQVDQLRRLQEETQAQLDALIPAVLAKAFGGL